MSVGVELTSLCSAADDPVVPSWTALQTLLLAGECASPRRRCSLSRKVVCTSRRFARNPFNGEASGAAPAVQVPVWQAPAAQSYSGVTQLSFQSVGRGAMRIHCPQASSFTARLHTLTARESARGCRCAAAVDACRDLGHACACHRRPCDENPLLMQEALGRYASRVASVVVPQPSVLEPQLPLPPQQRGTSDATTRAVGGGAVTSIRARRLGVPW